MPVPSGSVLRTTANFTLFDGTLYQNVFHFLYEGVIGAGDAAVVTAMDTWITQLYVTLNSWTDNSTLADLHSVDIVEWNGTMWEVIQNVGTFVHTVGFADANPPMPNQISPFVTFKTERPKSVGRKFLFPGCEDGFNDALIVAGYLAQIVAWANLALTDVPIGGALDTIVPGIVRTDYDVFLPFVLAVVTDLCGTQRRRRRGYGA